MALIDQRILIPAAADAIWRYLTDPTLIPRWNQGRKNMTTLSTRTGVVGTRRRYTDVNGKSVIEEITAWLENIGYEYTIINGPYREYRGTFRLQAAPEGTLVNWTVKYRRRSLFGSLRERFGARRKLERRMGESLRQLRRLIEVSGVRLDPQRQAKVAVKDAPDVEARAAIGAEYLKAHPEQSASARAATMIRPRMAMRPLVIDDEPAADSATPTVVSPAKSPPTVAASTSPKPIHAESTVPSPINPKSLTPKADPSFVAKLSASEMPAVTVANVPAADPTADTKPRKPAGLEEALSSRGTQTPSATPDASGFIAQTVPASLVAPPLPPSAETQDIVPISESTALPSLTPHMNSGYSVSKAQPIASVPPEVESRDKVRQIDLSQLPVPPNETQSPQPTAIPEMLPTPAKVELPINVQQTRPEVKSDAELIEESEAEAHAKSIWEVFGIPRPSEQTRTDLQAIVASLAAPSELPAATKSQSGPQQVIAKPRPQRPKHPSRKATLIQAVRPAPLTSGRAAYRAEFRAYTSVRQK
ncbi:MAG: hypothetical protein OHK0023_24640 [Anaerolineae bacterium]